MEKTLVISEETRIALEGVRTELISDEEYAALAADSDNGQRVARLEGYDKIRKDLAEAKKAAEWTRIDAEHLPQVGDELFDYDEGGNVVESFHIACEAYHGKMHMQDETAGRLLKDGYTHYRPISAPHGASTRRSPSARRNCITNLSR